MRKGSGWADWATYAPAVRAILDPFIAEHQRLPSRREVMALGYHKLLSAARHHHGGWQQVLDRLGYCHLPRRQRHQPRAQPRVSTWRSKTAGQPFGYWTVIQNRETVLRADGSFRRGIMPSSVVIRKRFPGLKSQVDLSHQAWNDLTIYLGVLPRPIGIQGWRTGLLAISILRGYERLGRWPAQTELRWCNLARRRGYRQDTGLSPILEGQILPRPMLRLLRQKAERHLLWRQQWQPQGAAEAQAVLNQIIMLQQRGLSDLSSPSST